MQLSVVILNYNVRYFLELCLRSVEKAVAGIDAEIIVVDNDSRDGSCEMVARLFPSVRLIRNSENLGFPKGNNIGVAQASGEFLCILNPDTVVAEDSFSKLLAFAQTKPEMGIVGCRLVDGTGKFLPESKRGVPTPFTAFTKIAGLYKLSPKAFGKYYASHLRADQTGEVEILVGAFMLLRRELYFAVGGFDEACFMYSDDIDLSYTVLKSGRKNWYFAGTTVLHYKGESTVRDALYMQRFREAMDFFYRKHFKISWFFDAFMRTGALLFSMKKRRDVPSAAAAARAFAVLPDTGFSRKKALKLLGKNALPQVEATEKKLNSSKGSHIRYFLDAESLSFQEIIGYMQALSGDGNTFRIMTRDMAIGSDSSDGRGEVRHL